MTSTFDLVCLSHLRWDFVFQRPHHLMVRWARGHRVYFVEEPIFEPGPPRLEIGERPGGVRVVVPRLPEGLTESEVEAGQRALLDRLIRLEAIGPHLLWYYTPMALGFSDHLRPTATVYDCMDELSAFALAPPILRARERELFRRADLVFTGGQSLYEAKREQHPGVHLFPSSVDVAHFGRARTPLEEPADQASIRRPRLGFFGVLDERLDQALLAGVAELRPDWQLVLVGPTAKIDPADLPRRSNLHYLGPKSYDELPSYLAGWDVALLPFARNESTRFISPTKTPEYLAAGRPVVSTPITDVVRPYGERGLVRVAATPAEFVAAVEATLTENPIVRWPEVDRFLAGMSWDATWRRMADLVEGCLAARNGNRTGRTATDTVLASTGPAA